MVPKMFSQSNFSHAPTLAQEPAVTALTPACDAHIAPLAPPRPRPTGSTTVFAVQDAKRLPNGAVVILAKLARPGTQPRSEPEWLLASHADLSPVMGTRGAAGSWTCDNAGCNACWQQATVLHRCPQCAGEAAADVAAVSLARDRARTQATALDHRLSRVRTCELALKSRPFGDDVLRAVAGEYASPDPAALRATASALGLLQTAERDELKYDGIRRNLSPWVAATTLGVADLYGKLESCSADLIAAVIALIPQQATDPKTGQRRNIIALRAADVTALREHGVPFPEAQFLRQEVLRAMRAASARPVLSPSALECPEPVNVENTSLTLEQAVDAARHACLGAAHTCVPVPRVSCPAARSLTLTCSALPHTDLCRRCGRPWLGGELRHQPRHQALARREGEGAALRRDVRVLVPTALNSYARHLRHGRGGAESRTRAAPRVG
jgi:hypothetical protein